MRQTLQQIYMNLALELSQRSTCQQRQVGCVIATKNLEEILAIGYNGNYLGGENKCDNPNAEGIARCGCVHAEQNALVKCDSRVHDKVIFVTITPCLLCAKLMINSGIKKVYIAKAEEEYNETIALLKHVNIQVEIVKGVKT